ncbi:GGDEF domain-containing protein [Candidatus Poribacteria bacterium]|nr:GGDEF domain-containing protein [Candidatus Poribacteria bacterium]
MEKHESELTNKIELLTQIRASISEVGLQNNYCEMKRELEKQMFYLKIRDILSAQLHSTLNVESIYENMRKLMVNLLEVEIFHIFFYAGDEQFHYLGIADGVPDDTIKTVLSQNRDEFIVNAMKSPAASGMRNAECGIIPQFPIPGIPMIVDSRVKGVMTIEKLMNQRQTFDVEDVELLKILMNEAAIALANGYAYRQLEDVAMKDGLTGLYNYRYFQERLNKEVERSIHHASPLSLLMVDVNKFKIVNDAYGHRQGDETLKDLANILRSNVRSVDVPARYGGDEFVIILPETDAKRAAIVAERIKKSVVSHQFHKDDESVQLTVSIGIASLPPVMTKEELIDAADRALYRDKQKVKRDA